MSAFRISKHFLQFGISPALSAVPVLGYILGQVSHSGGATVFYVSAGLFEQWKAAVLTHWFFYYASRVQDEFRRPSN